MSRLRSARGEAVVTMDADLQDDPAEIPRLLAVLEDGADLVSGWKRERRDPWTKRAASRVFNGVTTRMAGLPLHDLNCGFKAYRAEVVRALQLSGDLYRYIPLMAMHDGFRVRAENSTIYIGLDRVVRVDPAPGSRVPLGSLVVIKLV